jgi:hypothetical protein
MGRFLKSCPLFFMPSPAQDSFSGPENRHRPFLSPWRLSWVALVLLALYATIVLSAAVPVRLADPAWQLRLYNAVVNASAFPLVGLALLHLSSDLNPDNETIGRRAGFFARLAVPIALGFLLLIPLQGYLLWQQGRNVTSGANNQLERQERALASLREAVQQAGSVAELQQRFSALQGPSLGTAEQALPLSQLKTQLNVALEQADQALQRRRASLPAVDPITLLVLTLRNGFACLALAIGFAALGQRRKAPVALLMEWQDGLDRLRFRRRRNSGGRGENDDLDYLSQIRDRDD